ncbi:MAG: tetratricopeptide repeat protein [Myxococcota bacterium]|nr:tetratricopeptide repeat protein [Myxococcota bacterium]
MRIHLIIVLSVAFSSGCAHYPREDGEQLANEVYALTTQLQALQKTLQAQQTLADQQTDQLETVKEAMAQFQRSLRRNDADLGVQVDNLMQEMATLKGLLEGTRDRTQTIEQEIAHLTEQNKIATAKSEEEKARAIEAAKEREQLLANPDSVFSQVKEQVNSGNPEAARGLIQEFLRRTGKNKALAKYKADGQYWLGETFFLEKNYKRAARIYSEIHKKYAKSKRAPDAYLRIGECFEALKMNQDAKLFYRTAIKKFPKSKAAKKARARLKKLRKS